MIMNKRLRNLMAFFFIFNPFVLMLLFWNAVQCEEYERRCTIHNTIRGLLVELAECERVVFKALVGREPTLGELDREVKK